jgi:hypothetical protein
MLNQLREGREVAETLEWSEGESGNRKDPDVVGWVVGEERSRTRKAGVLGNSSVDGQ